MKEEKVSNEFGEILEHCRVTLTEAGSFVRTSKVMGGLIPEAKKSFFGPAIAEGEIPSDKAERFLEWFLLEGGEEGSPSPLRQWLFKKQSELHPKIRRMAEVLLESIVGVFKILDCRNGQLKVEDSLGRGQFVLILPSGDHRASVGDSLGGRIVPHPSRRGVYFAMGSTQVLRGDGIFLALSHENRTGVRDGEGFSQLDLEHLLDLTNSPPPEKDLGRARKALGLFLANEPDLPSLEIIEGALRSVSSPGKVLDPFLEAVAFHSQKDIGEARRLGLHLWNALQLQGGASPGDTEQGATPTKNKEPLPELNHPSQASSTLPLGLRVFQELEAGEARGEDLKSLFDRLGQMVGLDWEDEDAIPKKVIWSTSEVGDLGGLCLEFRWESEKWKEGLTPEETDILMNWSQSLQKEGEYFFGGVSRLKWAKYLFLLWEKGGRESCRNGIGLLTKLAKWLEDTQEIHLDFPIDGFLALWDREAARCDDIEGSKANSGELDKGDGAHCAESASWLVKGKVGGAWALESGNRRMSLPGSLSLMVGDLVFGSPVVGKRTLESGYRVLPSCLALLTMEGT